MNRRVVAPVLFVISIVLAGAAGWMMNDQYDQSPTTVMVGVPADYTVSTLEKELSARGYQGSEWKHEIREDTGEPWQQSVWTKSDAADIVQIDGKIFNFTSSDGADWCSTEEKLDLDDELLAGNRAMDKAQEIWPTYTHLTQPENRSSATFPVPLDEGRDVEFHCVHQL
jgi:hypothetical protein